MIQLNKSYQRILRNKNAFSTSIIQFATQISKQKGLFPDDDFITLLCTIVMRLETVTKNHEEKIKWLDGYNEIVNQNIKTVKNVQQKLDTLLTVIQNRKFDTDEPNTVTLGECEKEIIKIYDMLNVVEEIKPESLPF